MLLPTASIELRRFKGSVGAKITPQRWSHVIVAVITLALWLAIPNDVSAYRASLAPITIDSSGEQNETVRVWVNTDSGVYHCPGTRYYGATKRGKYVTEHDARSQGYRAAAGLFAW